MRPSGVQFVKELSQRESDPYLEALAQLRDHDKAVSLIEIVRRNLAAFANTTKDLGSRVPERGKHGQLQREAELEVNRHFLNFLAAVRQFLDHTETRLKRRYVSSPEVYEAFRDRTVKAFDGVFAYRFLYKLRNYSQHAGATVGYVDFESKSVGGGPLVWHQLHLLFDAPQLLKDGGDTWGVVRKDLAKIKGKFPVEPLPAEMMKELEDIWAVTRNAERPHLLAYAMTTLDTVKDVPKPYITPAVIRLWHRTGSTTIEILNPPVETMRWLGQDVFREIL